MLENYFQVYYLTLDVKASTLILKFQLIKTTRRLTFDILYQHKCITNEKDDDNYLKFVASNGYEIISRSRMDIQTERLWLFGCASDERSVRSGSMTFSSDAARDDAEEKFITALEEFSIKGFKNVKS